MRIANALTSYLGYIGKMFVPRHLSPFYPHSGRDFLAFEPIASLLILAVVSAAVVCTARLRRRGYLVAGWLWYVGTLVPVIGLVQVGAQAMADRYMYVPAIGLFVMIAFGAAEFSAAGRGRKKILGILAVLTLLSLLICSRVQTRYWKSKLTLYKHAIEVTEANYIMRNNYAEALIQQGDFGEAVEHLNEALRINANCWMAYKNLGIASYKQRRYVKAIDCFNKVLKAEPGWHDVYYHLGEVYLLRDEPGRAIQYWNKVLELEPDWTDTMNNLAWLLATYHDKQFRNGPEAVRLAQRVCELTETEKPETLDTLAAAYASAQRFSEAIATTEKAIKLAAAQDKQHLAMRMQERLELYKAGTPYLAPARMPPSD